MKYLLASILFLALLSPALALTGNPVNDIKAVVTHQDVQAKANGGLPYDSVGTELQRVTKELIDKAILDLGAASKDATAQVPPDLVSQPCWDAQVNFLKLLPAEWATPPTDVGPALAIQIGRDLRRSLTSETAGSLKVACGALFGDELQQAAKLFSILGLRAVGLSLGLPL